MREAKWISLGYPRNRIVYRIPLFGRLTQILGAVKKRADGRFNWRIYKSDLEFVMIEYSGNNQGVEKTEEEAKKQVEKIKIVIPEHLEKYPYSE